MGILDLEIHLVNCPSAAYANRCAAKKVRVMEREKWLKQVRENTEKLYDHFSPLYWVKFGLQPNETHKEYLQKFLRMLSPHSKLLSAGCGAGRYDGILSEAGHTVVGIDISEGMLERAREKFPEIKYEKKGVQEIDYQNDFDGAICIDALEHIFPEEWPITVRNFKEALKPDGILYFTLDISATETLKGSFEKAKSKGLPVMFGEVAEDLNEAFEEIIGTEKGVAPDNDLADKAVYHYYPSVMQVREWLDQEDFVVAEEGVGKWYMHFITRKM
jgi:2-polyprenyl-3-methyl-5-hydroxy-6-metoxy-1,4-benzoquinol methylase